MNLFLLFSQHLEWVKEQTNNFTNMVFKDGYICPICLKLFLLENIEDKSGNYLTIEHVPPEQLGGKLILLTCKECNSNGGDDLDSHLLNRLLELDFQHRIPGSETDTRFTIGGNEMAGTFTFQNDGSVEIDLHPKRSHPDQADKFLDEVAQHRGPMTPFNMDRLIGGMKMTFTTKPSSRRAPSRNLFIKSCLFARISNVWIRNYSQ